MGKFLKDFTEKLKSKWGKRFLMFLAAWAIAEVAFFTYGPGTEWLWLAIYMTYFCVIVGMYKTFGKWGLICAFILNTVMMNIHCLQITEFFGLTSIVGGDAFNFLITDILVEKYGRKVAAKAVGLGIAAMIIFTGIMWMSTFIQPGPDAFLNSEYNAVFTAVPRIAGASLLAFIVAQFHDIWLFSKLRKKTKGRLLWLRNNISTMLSQAIDSTIFLTVAFVGVIPLSGLLEMMGMGYAQEVFFAVADTFFIYLAVAIKPWKLFDRDEPPIPKGLSNNVEG